MPSNSVDRAVRRRVEALARRYALQPAAVGALLALLEYLERDPTAPTAVVAPEKAVDEHLADSLVALELEQVRSSQSLLDIGSGAGFPGMPLAIGLPEAAVALLESNARKCQFMERLIARASVSNARVVHARAETWREGSASFDVVTARAVASLATVAEYAAPLLRIGGTLVVWRGRRDSQAELDAEGAADLLGLECHPPVRVRPYSGAEHRYLHLMSKVNPTPPRFPRRPGAAMKRPLGGRGASAHAPRASDRS
jgi:16S rRNA (guanine527-N7)-methyltransferase